MTIIEYDKAKSLLREADVLLFRGKGLISSFIQRFGKGKYSHVGLASQWKSNGHSRWECVEFREWIGSRSVSLEQYIKQSGPIIDVYRPVSVIYRPEFIVDEKRTHYVRRAVDEKCITDTMRGLTGLPYGWARILYLAQQNIPLLRFLYNMDKITNDSIEEPIYPVCSTAVAYCYSKCGYDLVPNKADKYTEPSEISRSSLLSYLFTLG